MVVTKVVIHPHRDMVAPIETQIRQVPALLEIGHIGREHGDAHVCSKIYVLKYTECHPPGSSSMIQLLLYDSVN